MLVCSGKTPYWAVIKRENWDRLWEYQKRVDAAKKNGHVYIFYWFGAHADLEPLI